MRKRAYQYLAILAVVLLSAALTPLVTHEQEQSEDGIVQKDAFLLQLIPSILENIHYSPQEMDDEFSRAIFKDYLDRLDFSKKFFLAKDVEGLKPFELQIDDEIDQQKADFFKKSTAILEMRVSEAQAYYQEILKTPFDFTQDEDIELDADKLDYAATKDELKERWRKYLKYQTLLKLSVKIQMQKDALEKSDTVTAKTREEMEKTAREKVLKDHDQWFHRMEKLNAQDRFSAYVNTITAAYDPHTNFYPPKDKENFDISLSGRLEGIGATLQETDGYIKVTRIVPGSASSRQGELKAGDLILAVGQGDEDPVDIVDMRLDEAVQLIRGKKGTEVRLTVKTIDGDINIISIIRDVVILEETYAKSAILKKGKKKSKIGYINLPKFYVDFNNPRGRNCSNDVRAEIEKLKKDNVDGIIFDVRDNGGGSLRDVVKIGGFFVEKGPMVQIRNRNGSLFVQSDTDPELNYDGPLVILVNSLSASASEILAAAMQDYGRAIVIGSPSTYGKGTVQRLESLDGYVSGGFEELKPLGSVKLTTSKFYRVNGGATQSKGVIPDIVLPDNYSYLEIGEKELEHSLPWDEIQSVDYKMWDTKADKSKRKIISESLSRTKEDTLFQLLDDRARRYKTLRERTVYPLNLETYLAEKAKEKKDGKRFENLLKEELPGIQTLTPTADNERISSDTNRVARNDEFQAKLRKDPYIREAIEVVLDIKDN